MSSELASPVLPLYFAAPGTITTNPLHVWRTTVGAPTCQRDQVGGVLCAAK